MNSDFIWSVRTEYSGKKFSDKSDIFLMNNYTKLFINAFLNIIMFRRNSYSYMKKILSIELFNEFIEKVNIYIEKYGQEYEDSMYFLSIYNFSEKLENKLLDILNILGSVFLMLKIMPLEMTNDDKIMNIIHQDIKIFLQKKEIKYINIISFDIGCSSQAKSELAYLYSNKYNANINKDDLMINDNFNILINTIYNKYVNFNDPKTTIDDENILKLIREKQKKHYEYPNDINNNITMLLINEYIKPKFNNNLKD